MKRIDQQYLATPFYGSRRMRVWLGRLPGKPEAGPASDADHGTTSHLPAAPGPASQRWGTGCIRICWEAWRSPGQTPSAEGWAADITYIPMARGFHYLVLPGKDGLVHSVRGGLVLPVKDPTPWTLISASRPWKRRWAREGRRPSTPARGASSPARASLVSWSSTESESAWTGKGGTAITYSWSGGGGGGY